MVSYEAFDQDVEINGQTVLTIVNEGMGKFSAAYQERALNALADEGITDPEPDEWYPQQAWLNAFEAIAEELQPHVLDRLGEQIPDVAEWPDEFDTVPAGLQSIDEAYQRNHRGGELGWYRFEQTDDRAGTVTCYNPYPCPFDRGLIRGVAKHYASMDSFVFIEETGSTCRRNGDDRCTYTVYW
ncbi:hypothetical protein [Halobellus limi]|uniref:4-vinyl reductase 4VR domain-containing protein n=1 Tax=Halobellus limi TaxID=699433 RepID=A0A1H6BSQ2_9EURY|nr:hypothetical protein [Halobellus limi]SEG63703.1 hypothetical protein SAMN04488133_2992 [Halobellus limi]